MHQPGKLLIGGIGLLLGLFLVGAFVRTTVRNAEDPARVLFKWVITGIFFGIIIALALSLFHSGMGGAYIVPPLGAVIGVFLGIMWAPNLGAALAKPFTSFYDGGEQEVEERPFYAIARAKQKRGSYPAAIAEIRKQLHRFPEDYEGWMLLAEIYANDLKDKEAAFESIDEILRHRDHNPKNIAFALNRAADWHLKLASDREAARQSLAEIIVRFPDSELAHSAEQRIAHLTTDKMLSEERERPRLVMVHHDEHIGLRGEVADPRTPAEDPADAAGRLVARLTDYPLDVEAREELAKIYADHYQRMDLAAGQIEQLLETPGVPPKEKARWLHLLADLHVRVGQDRPAAELALRRVIELNPKGALAAQAASRIAYLDGEMMKNQKSQAVKLGSYENNLGLNRARAATDRNDP